MKSKPAKFSDDQVEFLSLMSLFESPTPMDILRTLRPLPPSEYFDLLEKVEQLSIIKEEKSGAYSLKKNLPVNLKQRIERFHTTENISHLLEQIESMNLSNQLPPSAYFNLLSRSGKDPEAVQVMIHRATDVLANDDPDIAHKYLKGVLSKLSNHLDGARNREMFIDAAISFSKLCTVLGKDFVVAAKFMEQVILSSEILGNKRAWALANLYLGFFHLTWDRTVEALEHLDIGRTAVEALGDQDIAAESAEFVGVFFFMKGNYKQALDLMEQAESNAKLSGKDLSAIGILVKNFSLIYLGNYYLSVGFLKARWREALHANHISLANFFRSMLGISSVFINQYEEALVHLNSVLKQATDEQSQFIALGIAFLNYRKKNYKQAYLTAIDMVNKGAKYGRPEIFLQPFFMEMVVVFEKLGYENIPGMAPSTYLETIVKVPNRYEQGIALRLLAMRAFSEGQEDSIVWRDLKKSEELLQEVGDPVQLAKTRMEMAVIKLKQGQKEEAYRIATEARNTLLQFGEDFFPDGLNPLLEEHGILGEAEQTKEEVSEAFYAMISELPLSPNFEQGLEKLLMSCNRFFGAEQGAIFWSNDSTANSLSLRTSYNITPFYSASKRFTSDMRFIKQAFEQKQPLRQCQENISSPTKGRSRSGSILCIPFYTAGGASGVLWHGNSYIEDCFNFLNENQLAKICDYLSNYISSTFEFSSQIKVARESALKKASQIDSLAKPQFIAQGIAMTQVINQAKIISKTDGSVLILGETGVGKELLARWIHANSKRSNWPIVTIDCTTIPETLIESELFGYEKGSFTGADRRKIGQVELADKGTLFIDEIGDIPLGIQVKLLRLLQEKKFKRIGGHQEISSDFRLIAATNRNLLHEVEKGAFRNDLYFRLHVFPITIPPLRSRKDEIIPIAEEFMHRFGKKYNRSNLALSKEHCRQLIDYKWPGNIRELENIIERSVLMSTDSKFNLLLPAATAEKNDHFFADNATLDDMQRRYILHTLEKTGGKMSGPGGAIEILGIKRTTLIMRMRKLGLR